MLTDNAGTGQVKEGMVGKGMGIRLSRADLAYFINKAANKQRVGPQSTSDQQLTGMCPREPFFSLELSDAHQPL